MSDKTITANELRERLTIEADFSAYSWHERDNRLTITLHLDGEKFAETSVCIEPAGYVRETEDY